MTLVMFTLAGSIGLGATWMTATRGVDIATVAIGPWLARPQAGTRAIDPYARAAIARSGELPLGIGDGVAFRATTDDDGRPLDGRCDVVIGGTMPTARFWTLTLHDSAGRLVANALARYGFTSQEVIRGADGSFAVTLAPRARAGNWLPTGGIERYVVALRFYDTPVGGVSTRNQRDMPMPTIKTADCPS